MNERIEERDSTNALRIVIGIDGSTAGDYAVEITKRLDLRVPQHYVLVNAVESVLPDGTFPPFRHEHPLAYEMQERESAGMAHLKRACERVSDRDAKAEEWQAHGEPAEVLKRVAAEEKADLVVAGHNRRNAFDDLVLGSVARELLRECDHHVLIARPSAKPGEGFTAVIATDVSAEAERCIDAFINLRPQGIDKVYVLTVNELDAGAAAALVRGLPHLQHKAEQWIAEGLEKDCRALCARLEEAGFEAEPLVVDGGDVADAISKTCEATRASLVVVASRPHGFWDRLLNGSVTEEVFAQDTRSLLVLRP
jgi:nucleotide-binding universal stress UspA family protein